MKDSRKERKGRKEKSGLRANAADAFVRQTIHDSLNAVLEPDFAKVDEQYQSLGGVGRISGSP